MENICSNCKHWLKQKKEGIEDNDFAKNVGKCELITNGGEKSKVIEDLENAELPIAFIYSNVQNQNSGLLTKGIFSCALFQPDPVDELLEYI